MDAVQGQAAGRARQLDRSAEERGRSGRGDLRPRRLDSARSVAARAGRCGRHGARREIAVVSSRARRSGAPRAARRSSSSRWRRRRRRRSRLRCSAPTARCISTSQVHGARRPEPHVVESAACASPDSAGAAIDSAGQSVHLGGGPVENRERPVTHWGLGAQRWQPRAAPGKYTRPHDLQRPPVHAAVRDLARRDAAVDRRGTGRRLRAAAQPRDDDQRSGRQDQPHRDHADAGRGPAQGERREQDSWTGRWRPSTSGCTTPNCISCRARRCTATTSGTSRSTSST